MSSLTGSTRLDNRSKMAGKGQIIYANRSLLIFFLQLNSSAPLMIAVAITANFFVAVPDFPVQDILFIVLLFIWGFSLYYFPGRYIAKFSFDPGKRLLTRAKKGEETKVFDLADARRIVSKRTFTNPGMKYTIAVQYSQGGSEIIFEENPMYWRIHWAAFSEKLSEVTGLPLEQELWAEDMNGKVVLVPKESIATNKRRNLLYIVTAFGCPFVGAVLYRMHSTPEFFLYGGIAAAVLGTTLSLAYAFVNKPKIADSSTNNIVLSAFILTLVIHNFFLYFFFYFFFVFLLNGLRLPGQG